MDFHILIPARYAATRLPGKILADIGGRPLIQHVCERARESGAASVTVAVDDERVAEAVRAIGCTAIQTGECASGSDRIAQAARALELPDDALVVNLQGDEPELPPVLPAQVARLLAEHPQALIATVYSPITAEEFASPDYVKVVCDRGGRALYFSRAPLPWQSPDTARRHIGLYAYRAAGLRHFTQLPPAPIEQTEKLEQLRALWHGETVICAEAEQPAPPGIDTQVDLDAARARLGAGDADG